MKEIKLIEEAIKMTKQENHNFVAGKDYLGHILEQFLRANTVVRNEKLDLTKYVVNGDEVRLRPGMSGIFHKGGFKMATDGHIMIKVKAKYEVELEGELITPKGEKVKDASFPDFQSVLPARDFSRVSFQRSIDGTIKKIKENQRTAKIDGNEVFVTITSKSGDTATFQHKRFLLFLLFLKTYPRARTSVGLARIKGNTCIYVDYAENMCTLASSDPKEADIVITV